MDSETLEVDYEDGHRERKASAPEDVGDGDGPKGVVGIRKDAGNYGARGGGDDGGGEGEEPGCAHRWERGLVEGHHFEGDEEAN